MDSTIIPKEIKDRVEKILGCPILAQTEEQGEQKKENKGLSEFLFKLMEQHGALTIDLNKQLDELLIREGERVAFVAVTDMKQLGSNEQQREAALEVKFPEVSILKNKIAKTRNDIKHREFIQKATKLRIEGEKLNLEW